METQIALYRFDLVAQALYEFVWNEYCDWFVELAKPALAGDDKAAAQSTRHTLLFVLEAVLRALHPIMPFITEEIWQAVAPLLALRETSVTQRSYPRATDLPADDAAAITEMEWLRALLSQLRRIRSEMNIEPKKPIPLLFANGSAGDRTTCEQVLRADRVHRQDRVATLARSGRGRAGRGGRDRRRDESPHTACRSH